MHFYRLHTCESPHRHLWNVYCVLTGATDKTVKLDSTETCSMKTDVSLLCLVQFTQTTTETEEKSLVSIEFLLFWLLLDCLKRCCVPCRLSGTSLCFFPPLDSWKFYFIAHQKVSFSRRFLCWPGMSHQNFRAWKGSPLTKTFPSLLG